MQPFDSAQLLERLQNPAPDPVLMAALIAEKERRKRRSERLERSGRLDEIRERCRTLRGFSQESWSVLEPGTHLDWGWALDAICDHLTAVSTGQIPRLLMTVPPGMMKSMQTGVFFPAWEWGPLGRAHLKFMGGAFEVNNATRDVERNRVLVSSDWYQDLWPHVKITKASSFRFENTELGWRQGRPMKSFTGKRADRVIIDDPHSVEGGESEAERNKTLRVMRETVPTRMNNRDSAIIVIMQRLHANDVAGMIIAEELGYEHLMLPMHFEPARRCVTSIGFRDPRQYDGELLFPERFDAAYVARMEKEMTAYAIAGQMQQRPVPREGGMFKRHWFEVVDAIPAGGVEARAWDLASTKKTQKNSPDWTVGLKGKRVGGTFYITGMTRLQDTAGKVASAVKNTATGDGRACRIRLPQDPGQAGKSQVAFLVAMLAGYPVTALPVSGDKETRAAPAASQAEFGNIKIAKGPWNEAFFDEVCEFPGGKHDDIVDALSDLIDTLATISTYSLDNVS